MSKEFKPNTWDWEEPAPMTFWEKLSCLGIALFFGIILWVIWWVAYTVTHPVK